MSPITPDNVETLSRSAWSACASEWRDYNYQQTWAYSNALAARDRARCEHVAVRCGSETIGLAGVRIHPLPVVGGGVAYVSGGPLTRRDSADDGARLARCLAALRAEYTERRGFVLRVLGPVGSPDWNITAAAAFREAGFVPSDQGRRYRTFLLDIGRPEADIRAACSKYWRRNLRRAERAAFHVRVGTATDLFEPIAALYERLIDRKRFRRGLDARFYAGLQRRLPEDERLIACLVERDGDVAAGLVMSLLGDTCVPLVLATCTDGLRDYAAYHLQWRTIAIARERGLRWYDLGGIDPEGNPGVFNFKKGLRGVDLAAPGPYEVVPAALRSVLARGAERVYRRLAAHAVPDRPRPASTAPAEAGRA